MHRHVVKARTRAHLSVAGLVFLILIAGNTALADTVTLAWDANTDAGLAGYKVYYGTASRNYSTVIDVANVTTYAVTGLTAGTYFFAVTAYNTAGAESSFSNEVSTTIPAPATTACDINRDGMINFSDIQVLANVLLGTAVCPGTCDLNRDGKVDISDLQILSNVILGLATCP